MLYAIADRRCWSSVTVWKGLIVPSVRNWVARMETRLEGVQCGFTYEGVGVDTHVGKAWMSSS